MSRVLTRTSRDKEKRKILDLLPDQGAWREEEYLWLTDHTNQLVEFSGGFLELLPMPTDKHQSILAVLFLLLSDFVRPLGGKVQFAPLRLRSLFEKFREPDLLLVLDAKDPRRQDRFWTGADLVLEVVSKDNPQRDLVQKRNEYARAKIPEYWIVNPLNETIVVYRLRANRYQGVGKYGRGERACSALLAKFSADVDQVFDVE